MRTAFVNALTELASQNPKITLITGDLGFGVLQNFAKQFPNQYLNPGVAEQNMTGLAAGMALSGKTVFTYSIANFSTLRCLEQIRNDICYHGANVKIVSVGGGLAYGALGISHHATEDLAILRSLPNLTVVAPGDPVEAEAATRALAALPGPGYLRLGKAGDPIVHRNGIDFILGKAIRLRDGQDLTLISTGGMLHTVVAVAERLSSVGTSARVLSLHTVKPLDVETIIESARQTRLIVTVEEHSILGGMGSAVAEVLAELDGPHAPLRRVGLPGTFTSEVGSQEFLRNNYGLSPDGIFNKIRKWLH